MADNGQRLDLNLAELTTLVMDAEDNATLVAMVQTSHGRCLKRVSENKETRVIVLIVLYGFTQHLHTINGGYFLGANGGMASESFLMDGTGSTCRIVYLYHLALRHGLQKMTALHQCYRMGVDFQNVGFGILGQTEQTMFDVQLLFSDNLHATISEQLIIVQ